MNWSRSAASLISRAMLRVKLVLVMLSSTAWAPCSMGAAGGGLMTCADASTASTPVTSTWAIRLAGIAEVSGGGWEDRQQGAARQPVGLARVEAHLCTLHLEHGHGVVGLDAFGAEDHQVALALEHGRLLLELAVHLGQDAVVEHLVGEARPGLAQGVQQPVGERAVALAAVEGIFVGEFAGAAGGEQRVALGFEQPAADRLGGPASVRCSGSARRPPAALCWRPGSPGAGWWCRWWGCRAAWRPRSGR